MQNESSDSVLSWGSPETQRLMKECLEKRRKFDQRLEDMRASGYYSGPPGPTVAFFKSEKSSTEPAKEAPMSKGPK